MATQIPPITRRELEQSGLQWKPKPPEEENPFRGPTDPRDLHQRFEEGRESLKARLGAIGGAIQSTGKVAAAVAPYAANPSLVAEWYVEKLQEDPVNTLWNTGTVGTYPVIGSDILAAFGFEPKLNAPWESEGNVVERYKEGRKIEAIFQAIAAGGDVLAIGGMVLGGPLGALPGMAIARVDDAYDVIKAWTKGQKTVSQAWDAAKASGRAETMVGMAVKAGKQGELATYLRKASNASMDDLRPMQEVMLTPEYKKLLAQAHKDFPEFKEISKVLHPLELTAYLKKKGAVEQIARMMQTIPAADELAALSKLGVGKKGWYRAAAETIVDVFGPADARRFAALLGATSPNTPVDRNLEIALRTWVAWTRNGRKVDKDSILKALAASASPKEASKSLPAWENNTIAVLSATDEGLESLVLSGPKVDSFYHNLTDDVFRYTADTWVARTMGLDANKFRWKAGVSDPVRFSGGMERDAVYRASPVYGAVEARGGEAARLADMTPSEQQETLWSAGMALHDESVRTGKSVETLIREGYITDEVISQIPDFATMMQSKRFLQILEDTAYHNKAQALSPFSFPKAQTLSEAEKEAAIRGARHLSDSAYEARVAKLAKRRKPWESTYAVTVEAVPSTQGRLKAIADAPPAVKQRITEMVVRDAFPERIAKDLKLKSLVEVVPGSGGYAGGISPNMVLRVSGSSLKQSKDDADVLSRALMYVFEQDAVPYFRADTALKDGALGYRITFDGDLTDEALSTIFDRLQKTVHEEIGFTRISPTEISVINFLGDDGKPLIDGMADDSFASKIGRFINEQEGIADHATFHSETAYPYQDWAADPRGSGLVEWLQSSKSGRPDLQDGLDHWRTSFEEAAERAYKEAGIDPPWLDVVETPLGKSP